MKVVLIIILLLVIIGIQHFLLEVSPEKKKEEMHTRISRVPASSLLPMYLSSLFMGPLRSIVINGLWISVDKAKDERRFFLAKEMIDFITILQPRNEAVWSSLAQSIFFDVAPDERDPQKRYETWERSAILKLLEGLAINPHSPVLAHDIGFMLWFKAVPQGGTINRSFVEHFVKDTELQKKLQRDYKENKSVFEVGAEFFERSNEELNRLPDKQAVSQFHLYVTQSANDQSIRQQYYRYGVYLWFTGKNADAKYWLKLAAQKSLYIAKQHDLVHLNQYAELYEELSKIIDLPKDQFIREGGRLLKKTPHYDEQFLLGKVSEFKIEASKDLNEFNDHPEYSINISDKKEIEANIGPEADDVDYFYLGSSVEDKKLYDILVNVENLDSPVLKIALVNSESGMTVLTKEIVGKTAKQIVFKVPAIGGYQMKIESDSKSSGYKIKPVRYSYDLPSIKEIVLTARADHNEVLYLGTSTKASRLSEIAFELEMPVRSHLKIRIINDEDGKEMFSKEIKETRGELITFKPNEVGSYFLRIDSAQRTPYKIKLVSIK